MALQWEVDWATGCSEKGCEGIWPKFPVILPTSPGCLLVKGAFSHADWVPPTISWFSVPAPFPPNLLDRQRWQNVWPLPLPFSRGKNPLNSLSTVLDCTTAKGQSQSSECLHGKHEIATQSRLGHLSKSRPREEDNRGFRSWNKVNRIMTFLIVPIGWKGNKEGYWSCRR